MKPKLSDLVQNRKHLTTALSDVRRSSLQATKSGDFRTVGKLTLEAARLNRAISDVEVAESLAS